MQFLLSSHLASPESSTEMRKQHEMKKPSRLSPDEALAYLLENSLCKQQYISTRLLNKSSNSDIFPPYNEVIAAKLQCRPQCIEITETTAQVL